MSIIMQSPSLVEATEMEDFGAPNIFAHGWEMGFGPEVITGISFVEKVQRGVIVREVVVRVHYPRSRWMAALGTTLTGLPRSAATH